MIIPYFKPYGQSSHLLAHKVGMLLGEKATHTGTLDPAAEGVLIVLTGQDRFLKSQLAGTTKVYQAHIILGLNTDTHDLVGIPTDVVQKHISVNQANIAEKVAAFQGSYLQTQPNFSAQREDGSSHFELAKAGKHLTPKHNKVTVESIAVEAFGTITLNKLQSEHQTKLSLIQGNFRQEEITSGWQAKIDEIRNSGVTELPVVTLTISCSKRTYIRALVRDLGVALGIPVTLFSLTRVQNGSYSIKDCLCLI